jgi:hypothetical protein
MTLPSINYNRSLEEVAMNTTSKQAINATVLILSLSSPSIVNAIDLQGSWTGSRSCTCWEMSFAQPETFELKDDVIIEVNVPAITPPQFFASAGGDIVYTLSIGESNKSPGTGEGVLISCDIKRPGNTELGIGEFGHVEYDVANSLNDTMILPAYGGHVVKRLVVPRTLPG